MAATKTARLDQILLQLGYVHVDEIAHALQRQRSHGGRLGMNLVQLGSITEEQLLAALAEQFRMPALNPSESDVPADLVPRMPQDLLASGLIVPLGWNETQKVLSVATSNPSDEEALKRVREAFGARGMRVGIAAEGRLAALGRRLLPDHAVVERSTGGRVALPELFADATDTAPDERPGSATEEQTGPDRVVMVTALASRKDFLPSVFEREGVQLRVVSDAASLRRVLDEHPTRILLSDEIVEDFDTWRREGLRVGDAQIVRFGSVSGALLDNPMAYGDTVRSLKNAVQALADYRSGELGVSPPYGLIAADVKGLVGALGLGVVAGDGLDLCAHLLLPHPERTGTAVLGSPEPFAAFASTLELATRLRFPWPLDRVLAACHRLYQANGDTKDVDGDAEIALAARILALVWHRHVHIVVPDGSDEERLLALRSALRSEGLKLAPTEVVEAYVNLIATRGPLEHDGSDRQVLLVGADRIVRSLTPALARVGRETVTSTDLGDAQTVAQRRTPSAIVIDHEAFQEGVDRFTRVAKLGGDTLLFVLTDSTDPALVLNLLDGGADDVFGPPHDFDLVAARINRSIRSRARRPRGDKEDAGQFSARFDVFSLLDLVQMLSQGMKTVRIDLQRDGEEAVLYMRKGRIIHAELGALTGEPAVHAVITWEDDGSFTVREETEFPEPTIDVPTESVLMDGLRLLDESRR